MWMGLKPGQIAGFLGDITESAIRTSKNHPKGLVGAFIGGDLAISAATAKKGEVGTDLSGAVAGQALGTIGGLVGAAIPLPGAALIGMSLGDQIGRSGTIKAMTMALDSTRRATRMDVGGRYRDTDVAYTMRQRAASEMSGSMMNARHWLGKEGNLFHT